MTLSSPTRPCAGGWAPLWGHLGISCHGNTLSIFVLDPPWISVTSPLPQPLLHFITPFHMVLLYTLSPGNYGMVIVGLILSFAYLKNFFNFLIGGKLLYNVVLVFAIQKCKSAIILYIYIYISSPSWVFLPFPPSPSSPSAFCFQVANVFTLLSALEHDTVGIVAELLKGYLTVSQLHGSVGRQLPRCPQGPLPPGTQILMWPLPHWFRLVCVTMPDTVPGAMDRTAAFFTLSLWNVQYRIREWIRMKREWTLELDGTGWISAPLLGFVTLRKLVNLSEPWFPHL